VETFVDRHHAMQVELIDALLQQPPVQDAAGARSPHPLPDLPSLRTLLEQCRLDEVAHRDDAAARRDGQDGWALAAWKQVVGRGSEAAVVLCRYI
jgi:ubiquinone biosynthesis monooxygenase Coq7